MGLLQVNGTGSIFTREEFGDCQVHVEWGLARGGGGRWTGPWQQRASIFRAGNEIQVLDSYNNKTYPDGLCGSVLWEFRPAGGRQQETGRLAGV